MLLLGTCVIGFLVILILYSLKRDPEPIFGVYHQKGKWYLLKYVLFLGLYHVRKLSNRNKAAGVEGRAGRGVKAIVDPVDMDRAQLLSDDAKAFDAVFYIAAGEGEDGKGIYMQMGCERRQMGICNGLFYLVLPGKGVMCSKKMPDTMLFGAEVGQFGAEGVLIKPVEPMKKWTISYKGQMWHESDPSKLSEVEFNGEWTARWRYFDYDTDLHPSAVARSVAIQPWSRKYFDGLQKAHQSHYEQFGVLNAKFSVDGESREVEMLCFRDHSFGHKRDWTLMHRYALHHIFLEDKTCISAGVVCQPLTSTSFEMGAVCRPDGAVVPVEWFDFPLYQHGEGGAPPQQYAFRMKAGGQLYTVEVFVEHQSVHYKGWDWEARLVERFCRYVVNGVPGRGTCEFQYSCRDGRPEHISKNDPDWYRKICHEL